MRSRILIPILFLCTKIHAQAPEFSRLGVNEGLSQNSVYGILQDRQGFLWIGTGDGLNRYDGKNFVQYRGNYGDSSGKGLTARVITGRICEDSKDRLWFGTNNGLIVFNKRTGIFIDPSRFNVHLSKRADGIRVVGIDRFDRIWLFNNDHVAMVLDPSSWKLTEIQQLGIGNRLLDAELIGDQFFYILEDGLYAFHISGGSRRKLLDIPNAVFLRKVARHKLVVHSPDGFILYDTRSGGRSSFRVPMNRLGLPNQPYSVMQEWPTGVFYLNLSPNGIARYNSNTDQIEHFRNQPADPSSLSSDLVLGSYIDRALNLWISTEGGGLNRLDLKPARFKNFPAYSFNRNEAANLMVKSIYRFGNNILIGTFSQGLYILNAETGNFKRMTFPELDRATSPSSINLILKDHAGNLWMNVGHAIGILDTTTFTFRQYGFIRDEVALPRSNFSVYSMAEYYPGRFIIGSNYGLHRMDLVNGKIVTYNVSSDSLFKGHNQGMMVLPDGTLMLGRVRDGFLKLRITPQGVLSELSSGFRYTGVRHFYADRQRDFTWMATENGLVALNNKNGKFRVYDEQDGMSNSYVYSIIPVKDSLFWLSTNRGLNKLSLSGEGFPEIEVSSYLQVHGLQSNEFNTGAFHKDGNGIIYFGGVNGINWFRPEEIGYAVFDPPISLTAIRVNEKPLQADTMVNYLRDLKLPYHQNTLAINFAALEFSNPGGHIYSYILEGADNNWIYSGSSNEARYSNLSPGHYVFRVKAGNGDGVWSEKSLEFRVTITPPFWQTWWFRLLILSVIAIALIIVIRSYIRSRIRERVQELEKENAINQERIRISRDMHDELGTGLTKITLLTAVGKRKDDTKGIIEEISETSRKLTDKMGEIIWTLSPQNDTLDSLVAYLKEYFSETTDPLDVIANANLPDNIPAIRIGYNLRQHLLLVFKEALNNAIKHSGATEITFTVKMMPGNIMFSVADNGNWTELAAGSSNGRRNGLRNMKWRMEDAGGSFDITPVQGGGTEVRWSVPV